MTSQSPPKPWERAGAATLLSHQGSSNTATANPHIASTTSSSSQAQPPSLPARPSTLNSVINQTASNYSPYGGASRYGASPYSGVGSGYNSYSSPYSRLGGMGSSMYGGGYGSMYGGMGGMGGMYGGMGGFPGQPGMGGDPNSLSNSFSQSTQATFQIIESIVGAFGGFAQMLESTYMATHSSFFAMISVAEQFSNLRDTLGSILGIFTILRWIRTLLAKVTGRPPPADATALTPAAFFASQGMTPSKLPDGSPAPPRPSKKPFLFFILAAFGLPYLMGKLIHALAKSQDEKAAAQGLLIGPDGRPLPPDQQQVQPLDPSQLDFCRVLYDYVPDLNGMAATPGIDLEAKKGDLIAVLSKSDPLGNPSEWWRCRARDGRVGYLPSPYLEVIQRRPKEIGAGSPSDSRAQTMTTEGDGSRQGSMKVGVERPQVEGTPGELSAEGFMKSQFYS